MIISLLLMIAPVADPALLDRLNADESQREKYQPAQGATSLTFNLNCTGTSTSGEMFDFKVPKVPVSLTVRVDLSKNRWCSGECTQTAAITEVQETSIIFSRDEDDVGDKIFLVNRETGEFMNRTRILSINWVNFTQGSCTKSAFTGFPTRKF